MPGEQQQGVVRTARGQSTRGHLLDAAERLFFERGVDNVSLSQIRQAAGQRNSSVIHFHFGDREGLLAALAERHMPELARRQQALYDEMIADGRDDDRSLVEVLLRPTIDHLEHGPSARAWIVIAAELAARPERQLRDFTEGAPHAGLLVGTELADRLARTMPPRRAVERLVATLLSTLHLCADRARYLGAPAPFLGEGWGTTPHAEFRANLLDMSLGALLAPATTTNASATTATTTHRRRSTHA